MLGLTQKRGVQFVEDFSKHSNSMIEIKGKLAPFLMTSCEEVNLYTCNYTSFCKSTTKPERTSLKILNLYNQRLESYQTIIRLKNLLCYGVNQQCWSSLKNLLYYKSFYFVNLQNVVAAWLFLLLLTFHCRSLINLFHL